MKVSVLMPVYNVQDHVSEAVDSILNQTFKDFEFIIIDDASTDSTFEIINSYKDERIVLLKNETNIGLAASLNKGIKIAKGEYIARMDGDDISMPKRLEKQVDYLDKHPEVGVLGTYIKLFGSVSTINKYFLKDIECKLQLLFGVPFAHPTVVFRKVIFTSSNLYYDESLHQYGEDYDLWFKLSKFTNFANLPSILLKYRTYPITKKKIEETARINRGRQTHLGVLKMFQLEMDTIDISLLYQVGKKKILPSISNSSLKKVEKILLRLQTELKNMNYSECSVDKVLGYHWFYFCYFQASYKAVLFYFKGCIKLNSLGLKKRLLLKFLLKPILK